MLFRSHTGFILYTVYRHQFLCLTENGIWKKFIKGFRFTPSNYPDEKEDKIQKYRKQGLKLPPRKVLRTPEQLEGIRESAKINTALLDYISEKYPLYMVETSTFMMSPLRRISSLLGIP